MKILKAYVIVSLLVCGIAQAQSSKTSEEKVPNWEIDNVHSSVSFTISHFFTPVRGEFDKYSGVVKFDRENLEDSKAEFTVDISSINTKNQKRDNHLQSEDFFNVKKWPTMKFVSERFEKTGENEFLAHGKLTIRDVTKDVAIPLKLLGVRENLMKKGTLVGAFKVNYRLNRNEYGVGTGDWAATAVIGDEVDVTIFLEVNRPKA